MAISGVDLTEATDAVFTECTFGLLTVTGGDRSFVGLPGAVSRGPR